MLVFMEKIRQLDMELFGGCNYDCDMCPQKDKGRERSFRSLLPKHLFFKIVDDAISHGVESISLHGSGEPTLCPYLPEAIAYIKDNYPDVKVYMFTNGYQLTPDKSRKIIEAGLDVLRISAIGYDHDTYNKWMSKPAFDRVRNHAMEFTKIVKELNADTELHTYHLITDITNQEEEIKLYQENWVDYTGSQGEIWLMHNWADTYDATPYSREEISLGINKRSQERSCGRMFQPMLQVRAGGIEKGRFGAVVACCMVLGRDSEAVLGHLDTNTIEEVYTGEAFNELRRKHTEGKWGEISYCKDCDQLYDVPESLVWSNMPGRTYKQSKMIDNLKITIKDTT